MAGGTTIGYCSICRTRLTKSGGGGRHNTARCKRVLHEKAQVANQRVDAKRAREEAAKVKAIQELRALKKTDRVHFFAPSCKRRRRYSPRLSGTVDDSQHYIHSASNIEASSDASSEEAVPGPSDPDVFDDDIMDSSNITAVEPLDFEDLRGFAPFADEESVYSSDSMVSDNDDLPTDIPLEQPEPEPHPVSRSANGTTSSTSSRASRLSRMTRLRGSEHGTVESYTDVTNVAAGEGSEDRYEPDTEDSSNFDDECDSAFARWLHDHHVTGNAIAELLTCTDMKPLRELLSWGTVDQWKKKCRQSGTRLSTAASKWEKLAFTVESDVQHSGVDRYFLRTRNVRSVVEYLLGNKAWKNDLVYAPYREWTGDENKSRYYSEMASGDWWWEAQKKLPPGATVVPLIIASDKTQVTNVQGDLTAYPVYLTIGNLASHVRSSVRNPGTILLAMLPVVKNKNVKREYKMDLFMQCYSYIFDDVAKAVSGEFWHILCADGRRRRCYPMISAMCIDHEEQVLVTGVNSKLHCPICLVPGQERNDLSVKYPMRTHNATVQEIDRQLAPKPAAQKKKKKKKSRTRGKSQGGSDCNAEPLKGALHAVVNFAWIHPYANIHESMQVDILHQLLKGVLVHVNDGVVALLSEKLTAGSSKTVRRHIERMSAGGQKHWNAAKRRKTKVKNETAQNIIDERFMSVTSYTGLHTFKFFSSRVQASAHEHKTLLRIMLPVYAPLLEEIGAYDVLRFLRAVVDFMILAMYTGYDDGCLRYMEFALRRMNKYKDTLTPYQRSKWNIPKWHSMTHYPQFIRLYGAPIFLSSELFEGAHRTEIKVPFRNTNKRDGWEDQVMNSSEIRINMLASENDGDCVRPLTYGQKIAEAEADPMFTRAGSISDYFGRRRLRKHSGEAKQWATVAEAVMYMDPSIRQDFIQAMAVFIREDRDAESARRPTDPWELERVEEYPDWVCDMRVCFSNAVSCMKASGKDPSCPDAAEKEFARCSMNWQKSDVMRRDWIFVQEWTADEEPDDPLNGRLPARLIFAVTIEDNGNVSVNSTAPHVGKKRVRRGVFVELYEPVAKDKLPDPVHGMIKIQPIEPSPTTDRLRGRRMYPLDVISGPIHVVPIDAEEPLGRMYINHTADWVSYNELFDEDWDAQIEEHMVERRKRREKEEKQKVVENEEDDESEHSEELDGESSSEEVGDVEGETEEGSDDESEYE